MNDIDLYNIKNDLLKQLQIIKSEESIIDNEIYDYFHSISSTKNSKNLSKRLSFDSIDINNNLKKIDSFKPIYEVINKDTNKLTNQIDECKQLSDRLSSIVRRLDLMQMRAQQALVCTEDVINVKDSKSKLLQAIDNNDLTSAVSYIKSIRLIDKEIVTNSEDYSIIIKCENEVKNMVRDQFNKSIESNDINGVMQLCPLLQTLGLEVEIRDKFINFIESNVFIAISADITNTNNNEIVDPVTGYAQALSNVFNSAYLIIKKYLSAITEGMESCSGDKIFIQKLHYKCEKESGLVLKRYMKYRNIKSTITILKSINLQSGQPLVITKDLPVQSDIHTILDELALLIQYCCLYIKYIKSIKKSIDSNTNVIVTIEFDKMIDELINKYYVIGECYLLKLAIISIFNKSNYDNDMIINKLDECFYVLQRCSQRSITINNSQCCYVILHYISELLSIDLHKQLVDYIKSNSIKINQILQDNMLKYKKVDVNTIMNDTGSLSIGLRNAMSLASSLTSSSIISSNNISDHEIDYDNDDDNDDPWKVSHHMNSINILEKCIRYTDRLTNETIQSAEAVFRSSTNQLNVDHDWEKIKLCKEELESARNNFKQLLMQSLETLVSYANSSMKEVLLFTFNKTGPLGGIKFDLDDDRFDQQLSLSYFPRVITQPFEIIVSIVTSGLSDQNRDIMIGLLADVCSERLEHFINQTTFRFAGALKFEECCRAITNIFTKATNMTIRSKFSKLREILVVLTSDVTVASSLQSDSFTHITSNDVKTILALRLDNQSEDK